MTTYENTLADHRLTPWRRLAVLAARLLSAARKASAERRAAANFEETLSDHLRRDIGL